MLAAFRWSTVKKGGLPDREKRGGPAAREEGRESGAAGRDDELGGRPSV
jgi:hypothetical protein